ncbi:MAG: SGNH/GDSL hydrolase family protein [Ferruginibacter sp.]|nr:SGNH/GDSL hydrolase family protein [Ferruginibacter sp.]
MIAASRKISFLLLVVCLTHAIGHAQFATTKLIGYDNKYIRYMGRVGINDSCAEIYWTGTSVSMTVKSAVTVKALLADEKGNNYYYVIVDGDGINTTKIKIDKEKKLYTLASNLTNGKHIIELFKVTNTDFVTTQFYGFETEAGAEILKPAKKSKRTIEFFGNSITCGHGAEDNSNNSGAPQFFNNYRAYGAITARHFNAQYHCTAKSGIGITVSWFPEVMPDIYDRLNPKDSASKWDFSTYTPDIVVVNLFQNDSWLVNMPDHQQFKARFGNIKPSEAFIIAAYKNFILSIRTKYPKARIICCLGNMDATREGSKWPGYIDTAVAELKDKKIVTHYFPYKNSPGHPVIKEQQAMADDLIAFIKKEKYWK